MALLAEQRRKTKFGLDPRNTNWSNDNSKFGQRLLEKMGWEKGKGLGAHEDGITEHIKASYKSDSRGLGCTPQDADAWIAHQDDFNDLLKALNSQTETNSETKSQESKAEQKKHTDGHKRYYGRFARGQAQTLRSTEDLDCIFGNRKAKSKIPEPDEQPVTTPAHGETKEEKSHGLTTVTSASSVQEYFAKKMAELKARKEVSSRETSSIDADSAGASHRVRDGSDRDNNKENTTAVYGTVGFTYGDEVAAVSSLRDAEGTVREQPSRQWYQDFLEGSSSNIKNDDGEEKSSNKKKRKKSKCDDEGQIVLEHESCNTINIEIEEQPSKKKKRKKVKTSNEDQDSSENYSSNTKNNDDDDESSKVKKQKKVNSHKEVQDISDNSSNTKKNEVEEQSSKKKKRKKAKSDSKDQDYSENGTGSTKNIETEDKLLKTNREKVKYDNEDNDCDIEVKNSDDKKKKRKKECKALKESDAILDSHDTLEFSNVPVISKFEENKLPKKKKSKENELEASTFDSIHTANFNEVNENKQQIKKKRKRKTGDKDAVDNYFHNLAFDVSAANKTSDSNDFDGFDEQKNSSSVEMTESSGNKKKKKRKYSESAVEEISGHVGSKLDSNDAGGLQKHKRQRKNSCPSTPDIKDNENNDKETCEKLAASKHETSVSITRNLCTPDVTKPSEQKSDKSRKKKNKKKKVKPTKSRCSQNNAFFPGSNIADILGYGFQHR